MSLVTFEKFLKDISFQTYKRDEVVIKEGDIPDKVMIVKEGLLSVRKNIQILHKNYWPSSHKQWKAHS